MSDLINNLARFKYNPGSLQRTILENLEEITDGKVTVVDPSTPFNFLLESSCFNTAMVMQEMTAMWRKQYKSLAATHEDLYHHLSDQDFVGLFSTPSQGQFILALDLDELKQNVVKEDDTRIRKLVIPRHSVFEVAGYPFTLQYPIELRLMPHGGLQVVYDNSLPTPLQTLSSNQLDWEVIRLPEQSSPFLQITIPLQQVQLQPHYFDISASMGLIKEVKHVDQFCYARAWASSSLPGGWTEIGVTHQDIVHNLNRPAVTLRVANGVVRAELPPVYITEDMVGRQLRLDIYTTQGDLSLDLAGYNLEQYGVEWRDLNRTGDNRFSAPLERFNNYLIYGLDKVGGGQDSLSFESLRERVLNNAQGNPNLPITQHQMSTMVNLRGYSLVKYVDNITDRIYHVARALPPPPSGALSTGANATVRNVEIDLDIVRLHPQVWDNGSSVTLVPGIVYEDIGREIRLVLPEDVAALKASTNEVVASEVNLRNFLYTPFYYVIDEIEGHHNARAYHLDNPKIPNKNFVMENETTELQLTTGSFYITKTASGYRITVITRSGDAVKVLPDSDLLVQLSFVPNGETQRAYLNGVLRETVDGERVYDFTVVTPHQIDRRDHLLITNFLMFDEASRDLPCPLGHTWDIMYHVRNYTAPGLIKTDIDAYLADWLVDVDSTYVGLTWETLSVTLGVSLAQLWCKTRVVPGTRSYASWETDEPLLYSNDVWESDMDGHLLLTDDGEGGVTGHLLHASGDPVLDEAGDPVQKHRVGDLKLVDGEPVLIADRGLKHYVDLYLVEGALQFVTDEEIEAYRSSIPDYVAQWLSQDLSDFSQRILERTELYLHPQNQLGLVEVIVDENSRTSIAAEQDFLVTYHLTAQQYTNLDLRQALIESARSSIQTHLSRHTVSISEIVRSLRGTVGDSVLDVSVEGLGGVSDYQAVTMVSPKDRLSIRKRVVNLANEVLTLTDDVQVKFIRHLEV